MTASQTSDPDSLLVLSAPPSVPVVAVQSPLVFPILSLKQRIVLDGCQQRLMSIRDGVTLLSLRFLCSTPFEEQGSLDG